MVIKESVKDGLKLGKSCPRMVGWLVGMVIPSVFLWILSVNGYFVNDWVDNLDILCV